MIETELFSSDNYRITAFSKEQRPSRVVISFTEFGHRDLGGYGFGGSFLLKNDFDIVAVKGRNDNWYQDLPDRVFDIIISHLKNTGRADLPRASYGSSMGGYAALMAGRRLNLDAAFAISPQYDIAAPWDHRWEVHARRLAGMRMMTQRDVKADCVYSIALDPVDRDAIHLEHYRKLVPPQHLFVVETPYAGHPAGYFLSSTKLLERIALAALNGSAPMLSRSVIRLSRRASPHYFFNLASACEKRDKLGWALSLMRQALLLRPLEAEYHIRLAVLLQRHERIEEAIHSAAVAVALNPTHPNIATTLSTLLQARNLHTQAFHFANQAVIANPDAEWLVHFRDDLVRVSGR